MTVQISTMAARRGRRASSSRVTSTTGCPMSCRGRADRDSPRRTSEPSAPQNGGKARPRRRPSDERPEAAGHASRRRWRIAGRTASGGAPVVRRWNGGKDAVILAGPKDEKRHCADAGTGSRHLRRLTMAQTCLQGAQEGPLRMLQAPRTINLTRSTSPSPRTINRATSWALTAARRHGQMTRNRTMGD